MADDDYLSIGGLEIPLEDVSGPTLDGGLETAEQNPLGAIGTASAITSPASSLDLTIVFDGPDASHRAAELDELANAPAYAPVALSGLPASGLDGYYLTPSVRRDAQLAQDASDDHERVELTLTRVGTPESHVRSVDTQPIEVDNEFGNTVEGLVGIPANTTKIRWFNAETGERERATPNTTRTAEFGDVEVYDALDAPFDDPTLIYSLPYAEEGTVDPVVWDSRGIEKYAEEGGAVVGEAIVGEGTVGPTQRLTQWAHVFARSHEATGDPIIDNGLVKLRFDEANGALWASEWTRQDGWTQIPLEYAGWRLYDVDLTQITTAAIEAQVEFEDVDTGQLYALDMSLQRGFERPLWIIPPNEDATVPTALAETLDPIAASVGMDAQPAAGLTSRHDTRQ